jgi:hypothetical protein
MTHNDHAPASPAPVSTNTDRWAVQGFDPEERGVAIIEERAGVPAGGTPTNGIQVWVPLWPSEWEDDDRAAYPDRALRVAARICDAVNAAPPVPSTATTAPVAWQTRCMFDPWHARKDEWCPWRDCSEAWFDQTNRDIASGQTRVQARALYTATPTSSDAGYDDLTSLEEYEIKLSSAIGTCRFMDPPDGGDVSLIEQVRRMRSALKEAEAGRSDATTIDAPLSAVEKARLALEGAREELERVAIDVDPFTETLADIEEALSALATPTPSDAIRSEPVHLFELPELEYAAFVEAIGGIKPPTQALIDLMRGYDASQKLVVTPSDAMTAKALGMTKAELKRETAMADFMSTPPQAGDTERADANDLLEIAEALIMAETSGFPWSASALKQLTLARNILNKIADATRPSTAAKPFIYADIDQHGDIRAWGKAQQAGFEPLSGTRRVGDVKKAEWIGWHPVYGAAEGTRSTSQQASASRLMMTGIAGNHGWGVYPVDELPVPALTGNKQGGDVNG